MMPRTVTFLSSILLLSLIGAPAAAVPPEVDNLRVEGGADATLSWDATSGAAGYDLLVSSSADLSAGVECLAVGWGPLSLDDPGSPAPGEVRFYLAAARDEAGPGSWGFGRMPVACVAEEPATTYLRLVDDWEPPDRSCDAGHCGTVIGDGPLTVEVLLHSGEVRVSPDSPTATIPGRGDVEWSMIPVYRSQILYEGRAGNGWNLPYVTDAYFDNGGSISRFDAARGRIDEFPDSTRTATGLFEKVSVDPGTGEVTFRKPDGTRETYVAPGASGAGLMKQKRDRKGNKVEMFHDALGRPFKAVDTMGRRIDYGYNPLGRVERITDFAGRQTIFEYDPVNRLTAITGPAVTGTPNEDDGIAANGASGNDFPDGKSCRFRYSTSSDPNLQDNIVGITYPNEVATGGPERVTFTYGTDPMDPPTYDRVTSMTVGGGLATVDPVGGASTEVGAGGTFSYTFEELPLPQGVCDDLSTPCTVDADCNGIGSGFCNGGVSGSTEVRKTTVTDPDGNVTEHYFNPAANELRTVVLTNRNVNPVDPASFTTLRTWDEESRLTSVTHPAGNQTLYAYDASNPNRYCQGTLLETTEFPDGSRGGDQTSLVTSMTYEPIFCALRTVTTPRANDPTFVPPYPDLTMGSGIIVDFNLDGDTYDATDGETPRRYRYTTVRTFDYQELAPVDILDLAAAEDVDLDLDGAAPRSAADTAGALSLLSDVNGDGQTQAAGEVIRIEQPTVANAVSFAVEPTVTTLTYNDHGQLTSTADPEGILTVHYYFPESDPDGDGTSQGLDRGGVDTETGGYERMVVRDDDPSKAAAPGSDPPRPASQPVSNSGVSRRARSAPYVEARSRTGYDPAGNVTATTNGRGIRTDYLVNERNQIVQTTRAAAHGLLAEDPVEPVALTDYAYLHRRFYDFNDNVIREQIEDRGDTSGVGGDNTASGTAFTDYVYRYDLLDRVIETSKEVDDTLDLVTLHRYDPNGNRVLTILPEGNAVSAVYDERDLPFTTTRGAQTPPALAQLGGVQDLPPYDVRGGDPSGSYSTYDGNANPIERADADDTDGSASNNSTIPGAGDRTRFVYDGYDRRTSTIDSVGNQSVVQYDPDSNATRLSRFGPLGGPSPTADGPQPPARPVSSAGTIQSANLVNGNLLSSTEWLYDELGRAYQTDEVLFVNTIATSRTPFVDDAGLTPGDGQAIPGVAGVSIVARVSGQTQYDRNSSVVALIEDDTDRHDFALDGLDRVVTETDPEGNTVDTAYDDDDNVIEIRETDVSSLPLPDEIFLTTFFYDSLDRLEQRVDNLGQAFYYVYDSRDNLKAGYDAAGPVTGATIARRAYADGADTINAINDRGNHLVWYYDGIDRLKRSTRFLTASGEGDGTTAPVEDNTQGGGDGRIFVRYGWDGNSLVASIRDDNGNETSYAYDDLDRLVAEVKGGATSPHLSDREDPQTTISYEYDEDDNLVRMTDEIGNVRDCGYDALDRQISCSVTRATGVVGTTAVTYEYDGLSRATRATDDNEPGSADDDSITTAAYDSLDRTIEETQRIGALSARAITSEWQAKNLRTRLIYPNDRFVTYGYDALDRLSQLVADEDPPAQALTTSWSYIGPDRVAQRVMSYSGGSSFESDMTHLDDTGTVDVGYDGLRRPVQLRHMDQVGGSTLHVGLAYAYDRMNNRVSEQKLHDPVNDQTYGYDSAYRLLHFDRPDPSAQAPQYRDWALDGAGNWKQVDGETRQHSSFNEIVDRDDGASTPIQSDDNGNLTDDGGLAFEWDYRDRLRKVTRNSDGMLVATYSYDDFGRRIRKTVTHSGALDGTTDFYYDGWDVIEERDGADVLLQQYVHGDAVDEPLILDRNLDADGVAHGVADQRLTYHRGEQSSVFALKGATGVVERYQYEAYGLQTVYGPGLNGVFDNGGDDVTTVGGSSTVGNPYLFAGRRFDPETGLYYYRTRYHSPELGRFISRDTIGFWGDPGNLGNGYSYVGNRPAAFVDPMGEGSGNPVKGIDIIVIKKPGGLKAPGPNAKDKSSRERNEEAPRAKAQQSKNVKNKKSQEKAESRASMKAGEPPAKPAGPSARRGSGNPVKGIDIIVIKKDPPLAKKKRERGDEKPAQRGASPARMMKQQQDSEKKPPPVRRGSGNPVKGIDIIVIKKPGGTASLSNKNPCNPNPCCEDETCWARRDGSYDCIKFTPLQPDTIKLDTIAN